MTGIALRLSAHDGARGGLRVLADLINDALLAMGTQPAFGGPQFAGQAAIETPPVARRPRPHSRVGRTLQPVETPPEEPVDESHLESWRLVRLAQDGDGEAFGQLYDRYVDTVFRFIYYRVNDRALAEDFTSETFLRALRRITTISYQGRDIGAWFITIARNIVLDHVKSARHRLEVTTADTIEGKEHAQSTETAVLDTLQSERLMEAVAQLGDEQRECVMLRFIQGLSVSETASVMGKNDGAIKALQHRAVRKLAGIVGGDLR
ncbi:MAG TPA: sigma-70 family RNA polymerase sigma factor [Jatrophihabitans sp.]|jgi:RNA polymerase sigma-70 factor (ECF subfamily)|uniref:sigma-70 family RNA polymerase sigma factor n=1 Tax=Jatrophihabitans sp. TaxID=1932789 RepID=UPI002E03059C|nr:sigma-70 family RNA polymerase sigma factor [Jatrophihabitans sp.]